MVLCDGSLSNHTAAPASGTPEQDSVADPAARGPAAESVGPRFCGRYRDFLAGFPGLMFKEN